MLLSSHTAAYYHDLLHHRHVYCGQKLWSRWRPLVESFHSQGNDTWRYVDSDAHMVWNPHVFLYIKGTWMNLHNKKIPRETQPLELGKDWTRLNWGVCVVAACWAAWTVILYVHLLKGNKVNKPHNLWLKLSDLDWKKWLKPAKSTLNNHDP